MSALSDASRLEEDGPLDAFFSSELLDDFPPVCAGFAYGSAVFAQHGHSAARRREAMVDLVFVVDDATTWHASNMASNADHYSAMGRWLAAPSVARLQSAGGQMYYNHATLRGRSVKYGVISRSALVEDLRHWNSLYVSGRLHKPVRVLAPWPAELQPLVVDNQRAALVASLLLLPGRFDGTALLRTICGLSYGGDVRMGIGESGRKPSDIAAGQHAALAALYAPSLLTLAAEAHVATQPDGAAIDTRTLLRSLEGASNGSEACSDHSHWLRQQMGLATRRRLLGWLPSNAQQTLLEHLHPPVLPTGASAVHCHARLDEAICKLWQRARSEQEANQHLATALRSSLRHIVRRSSLMQTAKGIATAGVGTSIAYALAKIRRARA